MSRSWLILFITLLVVLPACQRLGTGGSSEEAAVLEVEDVAPPLDVELSTEDDVKGPPVVVGVSGVLPSDYPRDLPTYEPSSVVDFGTAANGRPFVELDAPSSPGSVIDSLRRRLPSAGWSLAGSSGRVLRATKAGVEVTIEVLDGSPGSRIRVEY